MRVSLAKGREYVYVVVDDYSCGTYKAAARQIGAVETVKVFRSGDLTRANYQCARDSTSAIDVILRHAGYLKIRAWKRGGEAEKPTNALWVGPQTCATSVQCTYVRTQRVRSC